MKQFNNRCFQGERVLFKQKNTIICHSSFLDGESPLKESTNIQLNHCQFEWKYPLWYANHIKLCDSTLTATARAGIWYTNHLIAKNIIIHAPKTFRKSRNLHLENIEFTNASETLWNCNNIELKNIRVENGNYFAMNCQNVTAHNLIINGNYSFDGAKNVTIYDSTIHSKDAFWNTENVTLFNSKIVGEYIGWNSKKLKFINCEIESLQGLCYIQDLTLENCHFKNTTLAFEYSSVNATIIGHIDSILNPLSGTIKADSIGELILEKDKINPNQTTILCDFITITKEVNDHQVIQN